MNKKITIVTGLWDLGRGDLDTWAKRDFQQYKNKFFEMLETDVNMAVWIPKSLEDDVWKIRKPENTVVYIKEMEEFKTWFPFFNELQSIRNNEDWKNFAGWLPGSLQASLEFYNPMMMCKMFMVHDTSIFNPFNSDYFFWIDGGLTSTVPKGYFTHDNVLDKLDYYCEVYEKFIHITYPYTSNDEIHGFERKKMAEYCGVDFVNYVAMGGFFGGKKEILREINSQYYEVLRDTVTSGYMGADECLFTILCHRFPDLIHRFEIEGNGLVWPFFENLKNIKETIKENIRGLKPFSEIKTTLYVLTYNSPKQFEVLINSFNDVDSSFLNIPRKVLLNNSTDESTNTEYNNLCVKYGFEEIKKDNIGICGGRQWVAEDFDNSDSDYYLFFEDDMTLHPESNETCASGFLRYKKDLFNKSLRIIYNNDYDYLKLSFSEFFGNNMRQWAWYNVPQNVKDKYFPDNDETNLPLTNFSNMKKFEDITYLEGEVHYCNWPLWFSRKGNKKMFLDVKWEKPFEQTWMSRAFQLQKNDEIKSAILLLSPIKHHRFDFYPGESRREN